MIAAALLSSSGFLLLAGDPRLLGAALQRVWIADLVALLCLLGAALPGTMAAGTPRGRNAPTPDDR